jgi:tetratricopeptide (TPR) repeat protein
MKERLVVSRSITRAIRVILLGCLLAPVVLDARRLSRQDPTASPQGLMDAAQKAFNEVDYDTALKALDRAIVALTASAPPAAPLRPLLITAYELRARVKFNTDDKDGARADFKSLVTIDPGHVLTYSQEANAQLVAIFQDVQKTLVGKLSLTIDPADAEVRIDGPVAGMMTVVTAGSEPIPLVAGSYTVTVRKSAFKEVSRPVTINAGESTTLPALTLERVAWQVSVLTVPAGVDIEIQEMKDNAAVRKWPKQTTKDGPAPNEYAKSLAAHNHTLTDASAALVSEVLGAGSYRAVATKDCYETQNTTFQLPGDPTATGAFLIEMVKAAGKITVEAPAGSEILIDGKSRGRVVTSPFTIVDVCKGTYALNVRSNYGQYITNVSVNSGDNKTITAELRPAMALLAISGLQAGVHGPDVLPDIENVFKTSHSLTVSSPSADNVAQALALDQLQKGWLSFDLGRKPTTDAARSITSTAARQKIAQKVADALGVQAVAEVELKSLDGSEVLLTLLAAGSGVPDTIRIRPHDSASVSEAIKRFENTPPLLRMSAGMEVADVLDEKGAVVIQVDAGGPASTAGIVAGDVVTKVNGEPILTGGSQFADRLSKGKANDILTLDIKRQAAATATGRAGGPAEQAATKQVQVKLVAQPEMIGLYDQTLLRNKLILDFRTRLGRSTTPEEESALHLNLGVALMAVENWADASKELEQVKLPNGPGVSNGTVRYLLGLCYEGLSQPDAAVAAWREAAAVKDATLGNDGPAIKDLADKKLKIK